MKTARLIADVLDVPLAYLYSEDEDVAMLLLKLRQLPEASRVLVLRAWQIQLA